MRADFGQASIPLALDRPQAPDDVRARWRSAFAWANRSVAVDGLEPTPLGLQVQEWVANGKLTVAEAAAVLVRHYTGKTQT